MKLFFKLFLLVAGVAGSFVLVQAVQGASCPLTTGKPYKSYFPTVFYVTPSCTKQIFLNAKIYYSYFPSFSAVRTVSTRLLQQVPYDSIKYAPLKSSTTTAVVCSSFNYGTWGSCGSNGVQTRQIISKNPAGCSGGNPVTTQGCVYTPPPSTPVCTSFTYSTWGTCQSNNTQTRTITSEQPAGCEGGSPVTTQGCSYIPPSITCSDFTYSPWGTCGSNNIQTRQVVSKSPAGCDGGNPVISQSCTYVPPAIVCTSFNYSAWGACQNGTQTRTVISSSPSGCTGGSPSLSQSCTVASGPTSIFLYNVTGLLTGSSQSIEADIVPSTASRSDFNWSTAANNSSVPGTIGGTSQTGLISSQGIFTAPSQAGTYDVWAVSKINSSVKAKAWVAVSAPVVNYQVGINVTGSGTVTCNGSACASYSSGSQVTVVATPSSGYNLKSLSGDCSQSPCTLIMNSSKNITVIFSQNAPTIPSDTLTTDGFPDIALTRGTDKPEGNYVPALYSTLTLRASRGETIGSFIRSKISSCDTVDVSGLPSGVTYKLSDLPMIQTSRPSEPGLYVGNHFDPVVPKSDNSVCPQSGSQAKWLYVDFSVAAGTAPGTYAVTVKLHNAGTVSQLYFKVLPLTFDPNNEALPSYWIQDSWANMQQHYGGQWNTEETALQGRYLNSMRDHRMTAVNSQVQNLPIISVNGHSELDVNAGNYLDMVINNRPANAMISIPYNRDASPYDQADYLRAAENTIVSHGWSGRAYVYMTDEPSSGSYAQVAQNARAVKSFAPHLKVMVTTIGDSSLIPDVDIFVVLIDQIDSSGLPSPSVYKNIMAQGKNVWLYISCDSHGCGSSMTTPWPDIMVDDPASHVRSLGWQAAHYGLQGFLYYYTNLMYYKNDPFNTLWDFGGNGDGTVFYPGRPGERGLTFHQPIPSLRMKLWRETAFDAEYLKLLAATPGGSNAFTSKIDAVVHSSSVWSKNYQDYQKLRDQIADYIASGGTVVADPTPPSTPGSNSFSVTIQAPAMAEISQSNLVDAGAALSVWGGSVISDYVNFPNTQNYKFTVRARGDLAGTELPNMQLLIDGVLVQQFGVNIGYADYTVSANVSAGTHKISIGFTNDYWNQSTGQDRNLIVKTIDIVNN